jgi:lipocalin
VLTGQSAGGNFATGVAALTVENGAAEGNLLGVVMFDGVAMSSDLFTASLATLDGAGIPEYQLAAPPQQWNAWGSTTELISRLHPDQFTGVQIDNGSHADSLIGGSWIADLGTQLVTKLSPAGATDAVYTFAGGWINDFYSGNGPTDPMYGIYGNPNDGTYGANESIRMGLATATTLPAPPPVDIADYLGTWYELGSVKLPFEWGLVDTTAEYSLNQDGSVRVYNSGNFLSSDGPRIGITGSAVPVNANNTRLSVAFFGFGPSADEPGNYWILDYAPDYSWVIVSDPSGFSGYILSRTASVSEVEYQALVSRARTLGVWGPITKTQQG